MQAYEDHVQELDRLCWIHEASHMQYVTTLAWQAKQEAMLESTRVSISRAASVQVCQTLHSMSHHCKQKAISLKNSQQKNFRLKYLTVGYTGHRSTHAMSVQMLQSSPFMQPGISMSLLGSCFDRCTDDTYSCCERSCSLLSLMKPSPSCQSTLSPRCVHGMLYA